MSVVYRTLRPDEVDQLLDLRSDALSTDRQETGIVFNDFSQDLQRFARTFVAVAPDGTLLSTVGYWLRHLRDARGIPRRVGHVFGVATKAAARRQGHAGRLLELAIDAMRREGCARSILFAREEARSLYTHYGWRGFPNHARFGYISQDRPSLPAGYSVHHFDPRLQQDSWSQLETIYRAYNNTRPLTVVRDRAYWLGYARWMFAEALVKHGGQFLTVTRGASQHDIAGYVMAYFFDTAPTTSNDNWFLVNEIGALPDEEETIAALLCGVADEAVRRGIEKGAVRIPLEPQIDVALERLFVAVDLEYRQGPLMARTLAPSFSEQDLEAMMTAPGAISWAIDGF